MIYLASPYTRPDPAGRQWRFEAASRATARMIREGMFVFSPVVHSHPLTRHRLPGDWDFWQRYDRAHLVRCNEFMVLALDGWRESKGVQAEMAIATELSMPVRMVEPAEVGIRADSAPAARTGAPGGGDVDERAT